MKRFGGMVSFRVAGGEAARARRLRARRGLHARRVARRRRVADRAPGPDDPRVSVAGTDLEVPADLIRLSVGIETADDLLADLDRALSAGKAAACRNLAVCVDFGSTFTKAALVDLAIGRIVAARRPPDTTIDTDVLDGYDACLAELAAQDPRAADAEVLACSSAGGGLRIAVVGNEELVTAEAGAGWRCPAAARWSGCSRPRAWPDDAPGRSRATTQPDVVLLTGGTDGGNAAVLLEAAPGLVAGGWTGPVVVAGNVDAAGRGARDPRRRRAARARRQRRAPDRRARARTAPGAAIREMFLAHVIGGKHLSARADFAAMVRGATPDVVLTGVELLARGSTRHPGVGDVVVVDVGGATTDVHRVVERRPRGRRARPARSSRRRRSPAPSRATSACAGRRGHHRRGGRARRATPMPPRGGTTTPASSRRPTGKRDVDEAIARAAVGLALRRHAGRSGSWSARRAGSSSAPARTCARSTCWSAPGGVLRNGRPGVVERVLAASIGDRSSRVAGSCPSRPQVVVDRDYVLAAAGLLAGRHPRAAYRAGPDPGGPPGWITCRR